MRPSTIGRQRKTFGQALIDNQVIDFRMAELMTEIERRRADLPGHQQQIRRQGRHPPGLDGQAQGRPPVPRGHRRPPAILGGQGFMWKTRSRATATPAGSPFWRRRGRNHGHHLQADGTLPGKKR